MRILLVEDDRKVGAFLAEGLRQEGFLVDWAHDGDEAVKLARWFGGAKSAPFVNGVLDHVAHSLGRL